MPIIHKKAETPEAKRWADKLLPGPFRDLDFCYYGPENVVLTSSFAQWTDFIQEMEVRDDDVWVISYPKCGTTWTQEMVWLIGNDLNFEAARRDVLTERFPYLEIDSFLNVPKIRNGTEGKIKPSTTMEIVAEMDANKPRYIKSHLPLSLLPKQLLANKKARIIYVTRNPKDAYVSYYHHSVLILGFTGTFEDFAEAFITDNAFNSPYWTNVKGFYENRHLPNVLFRTYEEMKKDLKSVLQKTADFLGKTLSADDILQLEHHLSFEQMKANPAVNLGRLIEDLRKELPVNSMPAKTEFIRKGQVGAWKEEMPAEWVAKFDAWIAENGIPGLY